MNLRDNWRLLVLVVLLVLSASALLLPGATLAGSVEDTSPPYLNFGIDLDGGTHITAPMVGLTAEDAAVSPEDQTEVKAAVADSLSGVSESAVRVRPELNTVEVFADVEEAAFAAALENAGVEYGTIRDGVTEPTREDTVNVIQDKIDRSGLAGASVRQVTTTTGHFVDIKVPNREPADVRELVETRGAVEIVAHFPNESGEGFREETVLTTEQLSAGTVGSAQAPSGQVGGINQPHVPLVLTDDAARSFAGDMRAYGFTGEGVAACPNDAPPNGNNTDGYCLYTVLDGEVVYSAQMSPGLAENLASGDFVQDPSFVMTTNSMAEASELQIHLQAGALPARLNVDDGDISFLGPSLGERFKSLSLVIGIISLFAVAFVVFIRYRDPNVAAPMVVTALSEVVILLGVFAAGGFPLTLSHIGGFIAVIGTGVDDLIIIADEVMAEGSVSAGRVFQSRFRKAFWVIGAAAATTIIAMGPLAISPLLGGLRGFALVTILGVLVGVLITRPAYGDILRYLLTRK